MSIKKMFTQKDCIEYSRNFIKKVSSRDIGFKKAILFGSYATNQQRDFSDIDIAIVADKFTGVGFMDIKLFASALVEFDIVQVKTYNSKDYEEGDPLIDEINRTGIVLDIN